LSKAIEMADKVGSETESPGATKAAAASQRLKLQTIYGQALMWSRGFGSEETKAAFASARLLAEAAGNSDERFDAYYGHWLVSITRGELGPARDTAETFRREAERDAQLTEAAVARRVLGTTVLRSG